MDPWTLPASGPSFDSFIHHVHSLDNHCARIMHIFPLLLSISSPTSLAVVMSTGISIENLRRDRETRMNYLKEVMVRILNFFFFFSLTGFSFFNHFEPYLKKKKKKNINFRFCSRA